MKRLTFLLILAAACGPVDDPDPEPAPGPIEVSGKDCKAICAEMPDMCICCKQVPPLAPEYHPDPLPWGS